MILQTFITPEYLITDLGQEDVNHARRILESESPPPELLKWAQTVVRTADKIPKPYEVKCECHPGIPWKYLKIRRLYIYLLEASGLHKIGSTMNPYARIHNLHKIVPRGVNVIACFTNPYDFLNYELDLHAKYRNKRVNGEWFALDDDDIGYLTAKSVFDGRKLA